MTYKAKVLQRNEATEQAGSEDREKVFSIDEEAEETIRHRWDN